MREIMPLIDYGIDFHTGGAARANMPQVRCVLGEDAQTDALAASFAAPFTLHAALRPGSLREAAMQQGRRIIVYETGESLRLDEAGIELGIAGTFRVLHHLGMVLDSTPPAQPSIVCRRHTWLRAKFAGLFRSHVQNGQLLEKCQAYGSVADPYGEGTIRLESPTAGYVIGLNHMPVVNQGDALVHIAWPDNLPPSSSSHWPHLKETAPRPTEPDDEQN
jgi:predicted deacylase